MELFGPLAANVTVGHLMSMRSGIPDYDAPAYDDAALKTGNLTHSPYEVRACSLTVTVILTLEL